MKKFASLCGAALLMVVLVPSPANAQLNELMVNNINDIAGGVDPFGCDSTPCNLYSRYYGDLDPNLINGPSAAVDGYPSFNAKKGRFSGDQQSAANYPGIGSGPDACEAWYAAWSGVVDPGQSTFLSFYAASSTIVNLGETGGANSPDCTGTNGNACFGAQSTLTSVDTSPNTPQGSLSPNGGLSHVPVPEVTLPGQGQPMRVRIPAAQNFTNVNLSTTTACPAGSSFDDLSTATAPNPIFGTRLYGYTAPGGAPASLATLEGSSVDPGTGSLNALSNANNSSLSCAGAGGGTDCPLSALIPCNQVVLVAGSCAPDGVSFASNQAAEMDISRTLFETLVGTNFAGGEVAVMNTKVMYRGSVASSQAGSRGLANGNVNPAVVSTFSSNSTLVSYDSLVNRLSVSGRTSRGGVLLEIQSVGDFVSFEVQRAFDGVNFENLATLQPSADGVVTFEDSLRGIRGRGRTANRTLTYRIIGTDISGGESQALEQVTLTPSAPGRAPRR